MESMIYRYQTRETLTIVQAQSLVSKLTYSVEGISECHLDKETQEIVLKVIDESSLSEIGDTVRIMMEQERGIRTLKSRVIRSDSSSHEHSISHLSGDAGDLTSVFLSNGSVKREIAVTLYQTIDNLLYKTALERQAKTRKYPSMIPLTTLEKCGYVKTFPQNIYLVSEIPHQREQLHKVKTTDDLHSIVRQSPFALSPAVCFHCYEELSGQSFDHPVVLTATGNCFRHEASWRLGNHRLQEFSMREIVLVGNPDFVESERNWWIDYIWSLFLELSLTGRVETANDPFYFSEDAAKGQHQQMANMKYELVVELDGGKESFSIASFNNIRDSLCRPFQVTDSAGIPLHSGCVAFGIDRWVLALLKAHGIDASHWPIQAAEKLLSGHGLGVV